MFSDTDTVKLIEDDPGSPCVEAIDQTKLPSELTLVRLYETGAIVDAIKRLVVRGAPAIGVCAALGLYVVARRGYTEGTYRDHMLQDAGSESEVLLGFVRKQGLIISESRPTAVNLSWAIDRMLGVAARLYEDGCSASRILDGMHDEAVTIYHEDIDVCRRIGEYGVGLIRDGFGILTHCNAGRLATVRYGTATAPMYLAAERGMDIRVYCDETRPLLQGARLTAYELSAAGIDTTLLCDNMSASLMKTGTVDAIFVGCDRVAANGDVANKIGTSALAVLAGRYGVPFYVCAPTSTIDLCTPTGEDIVIEQRDGSEVTGLWYEKPMAPEGIGVYNPAFDVTDHSDITAIITENGVIKPGDLNKLNYEDI